MSAKAAWEHLTGYRAVGRVPGHTNSVWFRRLGGRRDFQFNIKRSWHPFGLSTWPPFHDGRQKRAVSFGIGYLCWRVA